MVCPTISGEIVEALDHVFITLFSPWALTALTFFSNFGST
jgi:hypothetical protein